jgi:hypothetical protein
MSRVSRRALRRALAVLLLAFGFVPAWGFAASASGEPRITERSSDEAAARVTVDDGVAPRLAEALRRAVPALLKLYAALLEAPAPDTPAVFLAWSNRAAPGRSLQADATPGGVLRLRLDGRDWADPPPEALASLMQVLAHELAHFWNGGAYEARSPAPPWLVEGNAELLGMAALLAAGLATPSDAAQHINRSFNRCFAAAGDDPWRAIEGRDGSGVAPACGMAIQYAALALAQRHDPTVGALRFWRSLWKAHPVYDEQSLRAHVRASGAIESADFLDRVLAGSGAPLGAALVRAVEAGVGVRLPTAPATVLTRRLFEGLMAADCGGGFAFWSNADHLFTGNVPGCKSFRPELKVRYLEGVDLIREPRAASAAAQAACTAARPLRFGTLDGKDFTMPCSPATPVALPADLRIANLEPIRAARVLIR